MSQCAPTEGGNRVAKKHGVIVQVILIFYVYEICAKIDARRSYTLSQFSKIDDTHSFTLSQFSKIDDTHSYTLSQFSKIDDTRSYTLSQFSKILSAP